MKSQNDTGRQVTLKMAQDVAAMTIPLQIIYLIGRLHRRKQRKDFNQSTLGAIVHAALKQEVPVTIRPSGVGILIGCVG
jgi:hypothetical protein